MRNIPIVRQSLWPLLLIGLVSIANDDNSSALLEKRIVFDWSREIQEYTVQPGEPMFYINAWGAAGGGFDDYSGGAGGYVSGLLDVPSGSRLLIVVGKGGNRSGASGTATRIYLDEEKPENLILVAAGGGAAKLNEGGRAGGDEKSRPSFLDKRVFKNLFFMEGETGSFHKNSQPKYNCSRSYKEGAGVGRPNSDGGNGLVVLSRGSQDFCFSGARQTFTVPGGAATVTVKAWGAGGGGSAHHTFQVGSGGGYTTESFSSVSSGEIFDVIVGEGGSGPFTGMVGAYGGGGVGQIWTNSYGSGGGGGRSHAYVEMVTAGGGGGAGGGWQASLPSNHAISGTGGGATGGTGGTPFGSRSGTGGTGGSQTAGGTGGVDGDGSSYMGSSGTVYAGGDGGVGNETGGGGGGGGYYGGGGGGGAYDGQGGGGGGGSSFPSTGSLAGSGQNPGNKNDVLLPMNSGKGGNANADGGPGFVYITW